MYYGALMMIIMIIVMTIVIIVVVAIPIVGLSQILVLLLISLV